MLSPTCTSARRSGRPKPVTRFGSLCLRARHLGAATANGTTNQRRTVGKLLRLALRANTAIQTKEATLLRVRQKQLVSKRGRVARGGGKAGQCLKSWICLENRMSRFSEISNGLIRS